MDRKQFASSVPITLLGVTFILLLTSPYLVIGTNALRNAWIAFFFWLLAVFALRPDAVSTAVREIASRRIEAAALVCWMAVVVLNALLNRGYSSDLHFYGMTTMMLVVMVQLVYSAQRDGSYNTLLVAVTIILGIDVVRSIPTLWSMPALPRITMWSGAPEELLELAAASSVGQYGLYTGLAIIFPVLFTRAITTQGTLKRVLMWVSVAAIAIAIALSTFMGAVLLLAIGLGFLAFFHVLYARSRVTTLTLYATVATATIAIWVTTIGISEQGEFVQEKFEGLFAGVSEVGIVEGDITLRADLWLNSLGTFVENPLFGVGPSTNRENPNLPVVVGGHSSWLDQLAEYGLLGFSFYLIFLFSAIKRVGVAFGSEPGITVERIRLMGQLVSCFLFVLGGTYNPVVVVTETYVLFFLFALGDSRIRLSPARPSSVRSSIDLHSPQVSASRQGLRS